MLNHGFGIYGFFVFLGLIASLVTFYLLSKNNLKINKDKLMPLFGGALTGGILGAKIPVWFIYWNVIASKTGLEKIYAVFGGRSLLGGIIGGVLGVEIVKKMLGIKIKTGDYFAPAIALGLAVGRLGCLFGGCCGGIATAFPLRIYANGAYRHPTQIYEIIFHFTAFLIMMIALKNRAGAPAGDEVPVKKLFLQPGDIFKLYIFAYAVFRFFMEFLREKEIFYGSLSLVQYICAGVIIYGGIIFLKRAACAAR